MLMLTTLLMILIKDNFARGIHHTEKLLDAFVILIAALIGSINVLVLFFRERNIEQIQADFSTLSIKVVRNGKVQNISSRALVAGDILVIEEGMKLPCDGILISCSKNGIDINESVYFGINSIKLKDLRNDCFLLSASKVYRGTGRMVACCVGDDMMIY